MKVKWNAVFDLVVFLFSLSYVSYTFVIMFKGGIRLGYFAIIMFACCIATLTLSYDNLKERFDNAKE